MRLAASAEAADRPGWLDVLGVCEEQQRYIASHPGGTVKIGELLDADLMTEYRNLYVCDASVIPEPWGRPPILTLIALGKRLAKHLTRTVQDAHEVDSRAGAMAPLATR